MLIFSQWMDSNYKQLKENCSCQLVMDYVMMHLRVRNSIQIKTYVMLGQII